MDDNCILLPEPTEDDIRLAAYYLWLNWTAEPVPDADSFWYEAEGELTYANPKDLHQIG